MNILAPVVALAVGLSAPALAQDLVAIGSDGRETPLTASALSAMPRQCVPLSLHGTEHMFEGPLLIDVMKTAGAQRGHDLRGAALAQAVLVQAADGYAVAYGLGELDPGTRADRIILADSMDGAPLPAEDGPYRVIVEGDLRPARAVRQVVAVSLIALAGAEDAEGSGR